MWGDLLAALALVLVIEGLLPFLAPGGLRQTWKKMAEMDDRSLRISGFVCMAIGLIMLYLVR